MEQLITSLHVACLKANSIALGCRQRPELLALLTQEKSDAEKNAKFDHDFKTLADVLIQEVVRCELSKLSETLGKQISGEESNTFTNSKGVTVNLNINDDVENTRKLLTDVLDGNEEIASSLSKEAHKDVSVPKEILDEIKTSSYQDCNLDQFGIWIDPIDGTSQYIKGEELLDDNGYPLKGLQVAKVLIGVYDVTSGSPVMGIVGSPFSKQHQVIFGNCSQENLTVIPKVYNTQLSQEKRSKPKIVVGSSESKEMLNKLEKEFQVVKAGGAGHKLMMVVEGVVDIYFNSSASVYYWDTCGSHSILKAVGGDILTYKDFQEIKYNDSESRGSAVHQHGIVAFRNKQHLDLFKSIIRK